MRTFDEIRNEFLTAFNTQEAQRKVFEAEAEKARKAAIRYQSIAARKMTEYHKLLYKSYINDVHWTDNLVKPVLAEIKERTGLNFIDYSEEHGMSTLGLRCECWTFAHDEDGECIASLCFTPGKAEDGDIYIDTGEQSGRFATGTIGEINGMNNKSEKVDSIDTVIENLRRRYPELNIK